MINIQNTYFHNKEKISLKDFVYFFSLWYNTYNELSNYSSLSYESMDEFLKNADNKDFEKVLDLHWYYSTLCYNNDIKNEKDICDLLYNWTDISLELWYDLNREVFSNIEILIYDIYECNDNDEVYHILSKKLTDIWLNIDNFYVEDNLRSIYISNEYVKKINKENIDTFIHMLFFEHEIQNNIEFYNEILIYNDNIYYFTFSPIISLWYLISMLNNNILRPYVHWNALINFFENIIEIYTWININIKNKFNAEVNVMNQRQISLCMIDLFVKNSYLFYEKISYIELKRNILPDEYKNLSRKNISRIKRLEFYTILENNNILDKYKTEDDGSIIINEEMSNAIIPIDYIQMLENLQENNYLWYDAFYENTIDLIGKYKNKRYVLENNTVTFENKQLLLEYLSDEEVFEFENSYAVEYDWIPEFMSMWIYPQASCQSITHNTWHNDKILWHIHNPLTKIILEFKKPEKKVNYIDMSDRKYIYEDWTTENLSEYIISRNILVLNDWENDSIRLQWIYWFPSIDYENNIEKILKNKYDSISCLFKEHYKYYNEILGEYNFYEE